MSKAPIAVALDAPDLETAARWARQVAPHVECLKVGLELIMLAGPSAAAEVTEGLGEVELFLDLKLHDIPNTVAGAIRSLRGLDALWTTVHALGGPAMIDAAAQANSGGIAAVTILTSLSAHDLAAVGITGPPAEASLRLAVMAVEAGADAIVCSPLEAAAIRAAIPEEIDIITPGVRPREMGHGDQARVATPVEAITAGADLVVIGRPITQAEDPGAAAAAIAATLLPLRRG